jgi:hypothetical protein
MIKLGANGYCATAFSSKADKRLLRSYQQSLCGTVAFAQVNGLTSGLGLVVGRIHWLQNCTGYGYR